jgi:hypothetical protein
VRSRTARAGWTPSHRSAGSRGRHRAVGGLSLRRDVDSIASGEELTVTVDAPPQTSRQEGYETAFVDMDPVVLAVE